MSTEFSNTNEALDYVRTLLGLTPDITFEKIETEPVGGFGSDLLIEAASEPDATEGDKALARGIVETMNAQETFMAIRDGQEYLFARRDKGEPMKIHFTIGPFRYGVDCWLVDQKSGVANRL